MLVGTCGSVFVYILV